MLIVSEGTSFGIPRLDLRLSRRNLALPGLQHLAEDHLLDLLGLDPGALERGHDHLSAELGRAFEASAPPIFANGVRAVPRITV